VEGHDVGGVAVCVLDDLDAVVVHVRHLPDFEAVCESFGDLAACPLELLEASLVGGEVLRPDMALLRHLARGATGYALVRVGRVEDGQLQGMRLGILVLLALFRGRLGRLNHFRGLAPLSVFVDFY